MILHEVKVHPSETALAREDHLAWKLAGIATEKGATPKDVTAMIINRIIDNAGAAVAAINRRPAVSARSAALGHMKKAGGAQLFGCRQSVTVSPEWAAWANGTAVRELGLHDLLAATDDVHPGDAIPPLLAAAQAMERSGRDLVRGIATAYEVQVNLAKAIPLRQHSISHIAHLCPAQAAGIGALLGLKQDIIYQAVQQAVQVSFTAGRSESSSWQSFASAHAGKLAVEAVDRAMRGETAPGLAYEGEDAVIAALLGGIDAIYNVSLPEPGEGKRAILDTFTKEHAASYPAQALIDLAIKMREEIEDSEAIEKVVIFTSRHTHETIGTGAGDAQAPEHSAMHVFAVALQDGF